MQGDVVEEVTSLVGDVLSLNGAHLLICRLKLKVHLFSCKAKYYFTPSIFSSSHLSHMAYSRCLPLSRLT